MAFLSRPILPTTFKFLQFGPSVKKPSNISLCQVIVHNFMHKTWLKPSKPVQILAENLFP